MIGVLFVVGGIWVLGVGVWLVLGCVICSIVIQVGTSTGVCEMLFYLRQSISSRGSQCVVLRGFFQYFRVYRRASRRWRVGVGARK